MNYLFIHLDIVLNIPYALITNFSLNIITFITHHSSDNARISEDLNSIYPSLPFAFHLYACFVYKYMCIWHDDFLVENFLHQQILKNYATF